MYRLIEALEGRQLLTLVPDANNVVTITGALGADTWEMQQVNGVLIWRDLISGATNQTAAAFTGTLVIDLRGGDDYLRLRTKTLTNYVTVRTSLIGGLGNDTIFGGENHDTIRGDDGDDRLDGRGGRDNLIGGVGFDTADYSYRVDPLRITLNGIQDDGGTYGELDSVETEAVLGGSSSDALYGDAGANLLDGGAGNDTIAGGPGNDTLTGGAGVDSIFGEDGNDYLFAREGLLDTINDGVGIDSASVDSTAIGDVVTDVPTAALPPLASATVASMAFASFASFGVAAGDVDLPGAGATLDPAFGTGGKRVFVLNGQAATINDVEYQKVLVSPGVYATKIVVVGSAASGRGDYDFFVARFNGDGSTDASFGNGLGYVLTDFSGGSAADDDIAAALAIDTAGRYVVAGSSLKRTALDNSSLKPFGDYALARYLPDGRPDTSFSGDGKDTWDVGGPSSDDRAAGLAIQRVGGSDRYLVVGTAGLAFKGVPSQFPTADVLAARWESGGSKDNSMGVRRIEFGATANSTRDFASAVVLDAAGTAWIAGYTGPASGGQTDFALAGLSITGAVVGLGTQDFGGDDQALGLALTADGTAVVVGSAGATGAVAVFTVDAAYGAPAEAVVANTVTGGNALSFRDVRIDGLGRAVAVGSITSAGAQNFVAARFNAATLTPDGSSGVIDFGGAPDGATGIAIGADDSVLAVGLSGDDLAMARFKLDKPIAEVILSYDDVQTGLYSYQDGTQTLPLPQELVDLLRFALSANGELTINGTNAPNDITIAQPTPDLIVVNVDGVDRTYSSAGVTRIIVDGRGGPDSIIADATVTLPLTLKGGDGNDTIGGGMAADSIDGGAGDDLIAGGGGNDTVAGGDGSDTIDYSSADVANPATAGVVLTATLGGTGGVGGEADAIGADVENLVGTNGDDRITGSAAANAIDGRGGNDSITGVDGDDILTGGDGNDTVAGGNGNDSISGGAGADNLDGGAGSDTVSGGDGDDTLTAGPVADTAGNALDGGEGGDTITGSAGADTVTGGDGNDTIYAGDGNDSVDGGANDDVIVGGAGNDTLAGAFGRDILIGGLGADSMDGGEGDDVLIGGYTSFDDKPASLTLIQAEWVTTLRSYTNRIANLNGGGTGGGANQTTYLRPGSGSSKTVFDDFGVTDTLIGGGGLDYFLVRTKSPGADLTPDLDKSENLTQVS
ncbi:MAG TPA: hypothetical protein VK986_05630 [Tepidisphaeraceae bacterium]|nr:hypothetical protein [Tepidisphaeraceae bacterium]